MTGRKKFKQAAKSLILDVKANEENEKQAITTFLTSKLAIDEKLVRKQVKKIMNERKFLVRNLVSGILDKNVEAISQLNQDLCRVSRRYHQLEVVAVSQEEPQDENKDKDEGISEEAQEMEASLKSEIKSLKQEVHITLTTLNNIFKEFSSMFGEDDIPEGEMSVDQIITAMESFSGKDVENSHDSLEVDEIDDSGDDPQPVVDMPNNEPETEPQIDQEQSSEANKESSVLNDVGEELKDSVEPSSEDESLNFSVDSAIDDIDSALDDLELGETENDDGEPDWGDAFAESGDKMEGEPE